ncbi:MAG: aspartate carbamoyltransferase catalytic subunit [Bdellovibrionales bacterium]|nr:aspartate carbamoyltransferase catalytic subunit [Bdellovibrionales bacterium]
MSLVKKPFLSTADVSKEDVIAIFDRSALFKKEFEEKGRIDHLIKPNSLGQKVVTLLFQEPSTRTRTSFQLAALRLGLRVVLLDNMSISSMQKGETVGDTIRNAAAMQPDLLIGRFNEDLDAEEAIKALEIPVINAGLGAKEHPTQALLDAFTIREYRGQVEGERVLLVGDVLHSRVANSNLKLLRNLGAEVAYCAPEEFRPKDSLWQDVQHFPHRDEAVQWASVIMGLRIQTERHKDERSIGLTVANFRDRYRIGGDQLNHFREDGILLHPGPVIRGVEFSNYVLQDPRCHVLDQVTNGVYVRAALMSFMLGIEVSS